MKSIQVMSAAALVFGLAFGGCHAKTDESQDAPSKQHDMANSPAATSTNTEANPVLEPSKDMPGNRVGGVVPAEIQIDLLEYQINMPKTLKAGPQRFAVSNAGHEAHSVVIEGNGVRAALPSPLPGRGNSTTLDVDLKPGTYRVYCPVDGHPGKGMETTITVQ